jgi:peptidyl-prolyl cis-trans isomerase C
MGASAWCSRGLVVLALGGSLACTADGDGLAHVGAQQLRLEPFQIYVSEVTGEPWQGVDTRVASRLLDQYLDRQVVLEAARQKGMADLANNTSIKPQEIRRLLEKLCGPAPPPGEADVEQEVARRAREEVPARAHIRQLLVDSLEEAQAARRRLGAGEDFVALSQEVSRAPNAADGGELGFVEQGGLPPEIDKVVFGLAAGEISDPVQGPSGYHVFQVLEVIPAGPPDLDVLEASVRAELARKVERAHQKSCIGDMAAEVGVEVTEQKLWFPYKGKYAEAGDEA